MQMINGLNLGSNRLVEIPEGMYACTYLRIYACMLYVCMYVVCICVIQSQALYICGLRLAV